MVLKFRLISNEQDDFVRDFEILADQTFFHLHMAIQENLHFDKSQIASFFTCTQNWEKEQEISLFELSEEESAKVITMENAAIGDFMKEVHDKMIYVFDVFNERLFFAELVETKAKDPSGKYPLCSNEQGCAPQQILMDQLFGNQNLAEGVMLDDASLSEDFPGSNGLEDLGYDSQMLDEDFPDGY
jgi:hypothetical protein